MTSNFAFQLIEDLQAVRHSIGAPFAGTRLLLITSEGMVTRGTADQVLGNFSPSEKIILTIGSNPDLDKVDTLIKNARAFNPSLVIALGGGSVLDTGKALSLLLSKKNTRLTLSDILRGKKNFIPDRLPFICIPTTSGTGAEVTPFGTIWDTKESVKRSLASDTLVPDIVILDPLLTVSAPLELTVDCALDACSHALESLWNKNATEESVTYALKALEAFNSALPILLKDLGNAPARNEMQKGSFFAGLAISISRTALAHSISYPLTLHFGVPHGLACSFTLPAILKEVSKCNAWANGTNMSVIEETLHTLETIQLSKRIDKYCSKEGRLKYTSEMFTPGRGDNFVLNHYILDQFL